MFLKSHLEWVQQFIRAGENTCCYVKCPFTCEGRVEWQMTSMRRTADRNFGFCLSMVIHKHTDARTDAQKKYLPFPAYICTHLRHLRKRCYVITFNIISHCDHASKCGTTNLFIKISRRKSFTFPALIKIQEAQHQGQHYYVER